MDVTGNAFASSPPRSRPDQPPAAAPADPRRIADLVLATAVRAQADAVYLEPAPDDEDQYAIAIVRGAAELTGARLDATLGAAVIARLAFLADIDLAAQHASSAVLPVRSGGREAEVVITVRPGAALRAEVMIAPRSRGRAATADGVRGAAGPAPGEQIGQYRVREFLGEGGMGTVYDVEHVALARRYALKVLRAKVIERDAGAAQKFLREARTAARVRHPNIVDVVDFGHLADGRPYFVMELLEGQSLADLVANGALPPGEVVAIARQLAHALAAAHDRGVVHADVTPSNVLVVPGDGGEVHVKLVDFGLAELAGEGLRDENPEFVLGTPAYISPEQLRGLAPTDRSDQYGLGAVLFELLTGRPPYHHDDLRSLCMMHLTAPIPPVESPHGPMPPKLADLVTTCLQKTPQARFPGMRALLGALDEVERVTDRRGWRRWLSS